MAESEFADHQMSRSADGTSSADGTLSNGEVLAGEAGVLAVLVDRGRANRERHRGGLGSPSATAAIIASSSEATASTTGPDERDAGWDGQSVADGVAQPDRLRAEDRRVARLGERDDLASPEHRDLARGAVDTHQRAVGDAFGRLTRSHHTGDAVLARHDRGVREQAAVVGHDRAEQRQQDVERLGRRRA